MSINYLKWNVKTRPISVLEKEQTTLTPPLYLLPLLAPLSKRWRPLTCLKCRSGVTPDVPSKHLIEIESFSSWAHIDPGKGKHSKITFARDWGSPQIIEDNVVIRDFPLGCQGPSANSWCLGWLAQRPQDLRHIYAQLLPGSALLSKYRSHISGIQCSSWSFCPFKTRSDWIFVQLAGCGEDKYLSVVLLSICFASRVPWYFDTNNNRKFEIRWRLAKQTLSSHSRFLWASALIISRHLGGKNTFKFRSSNQNTFPTFW